MHPDDQLFRAVWKGDLTAVKKAIGKGAAVDCQDEDGYTPLMNACYDGHMEIVRFLIDKGADPNHWAQGDNPLMRAAAGGRREVYEYLKPIVRDEIRNSTNERELETNEKRRAREANTTVEALILDAGMGKLEKVRHALENGVDPNSIGSKGQGALHIAACYGHLAIVKLLLKFGADVNLRIEHGGGLGDEGTTALHLASASFYAQSHEELIRALFEAGADVDAQDVNGKTPLMRAVELQFAYPVSVQTLVQIGANLDVRDREGNTALMLALLQSEQHVVTRRQNLERIIEVLRVAGASENGTNEVKLIKAAYNGDAKTVRELLAGSALDIDHSYHGTALSRASIHGHADIARALVEAGANVDMVETKSGFTPLIRAAYGGHLETTRLLVKAGAVLTAQIEGVGTALDYARLGKRERGEDRPYDEIIRLLAAAGTPSTAR